MRWVAILVVLVAGCRIPQDTPEILVSMSRLPIMCNEKGKAWTPLTVFITLYRMPDQPVLVDMDGYVKTTLYGQQVTVVFDKLGIGGHTLTITAGDRQTERVLRVVECQ